MWWRRKKNNKKGDDSHSASALLLPLSRRRSPDVRIRQFAQPGGDYSVGRPAGEKIHQHFFVHSRARGPLIIIARFYTPRLCEEASAEAPFPARVNRYRFWWVPRDRAKPRGLHARRWHQASPCELPKVKIERTLQSCSRSAPQKGARTVGSLLIKLTITLFALRVCCALWGHGVPQAKKSE